MRTFLLMHLGPTFECWEKDVLKGDSALWAGHGTVLGEDLWFLFIIQMGSLVKIDMGTLVIRNNMV